MTDTSANEQSKFKRWLKGGYREQAAANVECINISGKIVKLGGLGIDLTARTVTWEKETVAWSDITDIAFEQDLPVKRITATRVVAGGVLFGPAGAVVGALAKKQVNKTGWLIIDIPDGQWLIEVQKKGLSDVRRFIQRIKSGQATT